MKKYFIPTKNNNFTPVLLRRSALVIYVLVIFLFNMVVGQMNFATVFASIDASALYSLHNSNRAANGIGGLTVNQQLVNSATNKANAMLESNCWDHYCPPGTSPWSFILNSGYEYVYAGENLGEGFVDSNTLMNAWMNSPTHRANILNGNFTEIGIGFAYGTYQGKANNTIIVVHFGSKKNSAPVNPPVQPTVEVKMETHVTSPSPTTRPVRPIATNIPQKFVANPTKIPNIEIDQPSEGSILNADNLVISGTKPDSSNLEIYLNGEELGKVDNKGVNFSYRPGKLTDGDKTVKVIGFINNKQVTESSEVNFVIDSTPPKINKDDVEISYSGKSDNDEITIKLKVKEDGVKVYLDGNKKEFKNLSDSYWSINFVKKEIESSILVKVVAEDKAGNRTFLEIPTSEVLGYFEHSSFLTRDNQNITKTNISGPLLGSFSVSGIRSKVNLVFIFFLLILFSLDFYFLNKSGLTGLRKSKSHLQISAIVILFMVMLVGGFTGSIL